MAKSSKFHSWRASLCALGEYLRRLQFFAPLREQVKIPQKTVKHRPVDKLLDAMMGMLCGAKTIAQSNVTVRVDAAVQRAFGRQGCAEQSTIARTLHACTAQTVTQLEGLSWYYLKRYGQTPHHRFAEQRLWVDIDVTPLPIEGTRQIRSILYAKSGVNRACPQRKHCFSAEFSDDFREPGTRK